MYFKIQVIKQHVCYYYVKSNEYITNLSPLKAVYMFRRAL